MYSRSQSKGAFDELDAFDEMSDEEYELYRYNLPPKYDGNRFRRRNTVCASQCSTPSSEVTPDVSCEARVHCDDEKKDEIPHCPCREENKSTRCDSDESREIPGIRSTLSRLSEHIGYEELLIIAVILMLGGDGGDDIILLLAVLLAQGTDESRRTRC